MLSDELIMLAIVVASRSNSAMWQPQPLLCLLRADTRTRPVNGSVPDLCSGRRFLSPESCACTWLYPFDEQRA